MTNKHLAVVKSQARFSKFGSEFVVGTHHTYVDPEGATDKELDIFSYRMAKFAHLSVENQYILQTSFDDTTPLSCVLLKGQKGACCQEGLY